MALPERVAALEKRLLQMDGSTPAKINNPCPLCGAELKTVKVARDPIFGDVGLQQHTLKCSNCEHTETRQIDPKRGPQV